MRIYRLFSTANDASFSVSFEERRAFFELLRQRQLEAGSSFFSKLLSETCPCCGYPVFDRESKRNHTCLICGWPFQSLSQKKQLWNMLEDARERFEKEWIAVPLTDVQAWLGWNTPFDLRLHQAIVSFFNRMVGESEYEMLNHLLEACHQLLSYLAFRRDAGMQLWESHKKILDDNEEAIFDFNESEINKTFFDFVDVGEWDYLNYFLNPYYCLSVSYDPEKDVLLYFEVAETDALGDRDFIYFSLNLQVDDPLFLQLDHGAIDEPTLVALRDFTGKPLGFVPLGHTPKIIDWMKKGAQLSAVVEKVDVEGQQLQVGVKLLCFSSSWCLDGDQ